jgi:hypothetical protein
MLFLADTSILLRLLEPSDPQHAVVRTAFRLLRGRGHQGVTSPQNASEFWNVCTRPATARGGFGLSVAEADFARYPGVTALMPAAVLASPP